MDFSNYKFRCSSLGHLMTEARSKSEYLSETTKTHLMECYIGAVFNRKKDLTNKFLTKGIEAEESSIDLLSITQKDFYIKNETRFSNDFIQGTPDIVIEDQSLVIDIKSSFDIYTFAASQKAENKMYYWQLQGYMWLTGCNKAWLSYCLVNTPDAIIEREISKALYQSGVSENSKEFQEYAEEMRAFHRYEDIEKSKRIFIKNYDFDSQAIEKLQERILECRNYLNNINW